MTWTEPASRKTKIASQRRQTAERTRGVPGVTTLVHGTAAELDHGRSHGAVGPGERDYLACLKTRFFCRPCGSEAQDVRQQDRFLLVRSLLKSVTSTRAATGAGGELCRSTSSASRLSLRSKPLASSIHPTAVGSRQSTADRVHRRNSTRLHRGSRCNARPSCH